MSIKVHELAKQLSLPAKQLITMMGRFGIQAKDAFHDLSEDQVNLVKAKVSNTGSTTVFVVPSAAESAAARERKRIRLHAEEAALAKVKEDAEKGQQTTHGQQALQGQHSQPAHPSHLADNAHGDNKGGARRIRKHAKEDGGTVGLVHEDAPKTEEAPAKVEGEAPTVKQAALEPTGTTVKSVQEIKPEKDGNKSNEAPAIVVKGKTQEPAKVENDNKKPASTTPPVGQAHAPAGPVLKSAEDASGHKVKKIEPVFEEDEFETQEVRDGKRKAHEKEKKGFKAPGKEIRFDKKGHRIPDETPVVDPKFKKIPVGITVVEFEEDETEEFFRPRKRRGDRKNKQKSKPVIELKHTFNPRKKSIKIGNIVSVGELAGLIGIKAGEIIKKLIGMDIMATINQNISGEIATLIAVEFNVDVEHVTNNMEDILIEEVAEEKDQMPRAPIVTIMGHVDHGKTSLLDKIRSTHVTLGEAGGITQHIGAYNVQTDVGAITFLDTPGHEAFTAMRARGAHVTDIVILVVAADDGVQPQTIEAIHHAQAANVPIIVAINKIDKPDANPSRIQQDLLSHNLVAEEFGGQTIFVQVSAKSGQGLKQLLEMVQLQAEILELKANVEGMARGVIIEAKISKGRGSVGTVLVQKGSLKIGDYFVVGGTYGRVRALFDDKGQPIEVALPSSPVEVLGFQEVPNSGEPFVVVEAEKVARQIAATRAHKSKDEAATHKQKMHLETLFSRMSKEGQLELNILIKGDVQGSVEALQTSLRQLGTEKVAVRFIHTAVGAITETDVMLASASDAIIIGFNTTPDANAKVAISSEGIDVRIYNIIYNAIEDVKKAMEGMLKPTIREEITGHLRVQKIYNANKAGQILGCLVTDGHVQRNANVRVLRNEQVVHDGVFTSLRRFKDDVKEVLTNYECGVGVDTSDIQENDILEAYVKVEEVAKL